MAKAVRWTPKAVSTYMEVLSYLSERWTEKQEQRFVGDVENTLQYIVRYPEGFQRIGHERLRAATIKPYNLLIYRIDPTAIIVIGLFDMRRHPKYLKELKKGWRDA